MLDNFYNQMLESVTQAKNKIDLDAIVVNVSQVTCLSDVSVDVSDKKKDIALLLRDKVYELVLNQGDIFEKEYLLLQAFFLHLDLPPDDRFIPYAKLGISQLEEAGGFFETAQAVVFVEFITVCLFLGGKNQGSIYSFIQSMSVLHLIDVALLERSDLAIKFFCVSQIPFEEVQDVFKDLFDCEKFFNLSPESRRNLFRWVLHEWWNVPQWFNHLGWLALYEPWKKIFYRALEEDFDLAVYLQYFIYHIMGNSFQTQEEWKTFNDEITKKAEPYYVNYGKMLTPCKKEMSEGKKIIGFLRDRIVDNAPFKVEYSFLKAFLSHKDHKDKYDVRLYLMGFVEKSNDDQEIIKDYEDIGVTVINAVETLNNNERYYASHLKRALLIRERIIADGVDILVSPNNGYGVSDFILATRCAPKQIFWSHGNEPYDMAGIDRRISHIILKKYFEFEYMPVNVDIDRFYNPPVTKESIFVVSSQYPKDKIILGVIGRLVKVDSEEYLRVIAHILNKHENTIFIAAGHGNFDSVEEKIRRLGISKDRFFMPGHVDPHVYGHIIDIFCDTFPLVQGESKTEFFCKKGRIACTYLEFANKKEFLAQYLSDVDEYIKHYNLLERHDIERVSLEEFKEIAMAVQDFWFFEPEESIQSIEAAMRFIQGPYREKLYTVLNSMRFLRQQYTADDQFLKIFD